MNARERLVCAALFKARFGREPRVRDETLVQAEIAGARKLLQALSGVS
jgi:hypothetical protein